MTQNHRTADVESVQEVLREIVERVLQEILEAQMTQHIGAAPCERAEWRPGQRNGHKPRMLRTRVGTLDLLVPKERKRADLFLEETTETSGLDQRASCLGRLA